MPDKEYLIKISLELWYWIDKILLDYPILIPERYDKHLMQKCEVIQRLVNKEMPNCKLAENGNYLIHIIQRSKKSTTLIFDEIKSAIHHVILIPNGCNPTKFGQ